LNKATNGSATSSATLKGAIMKKILATMAFAVALAASSASADHPLPPVPWGLTIINVVECDDTETGERGVCFLKQDAAGNTYIVFRQNDIIMFIRQVFPDKPYDTLWMADKYATY
jgi:hypothetical protein